MWSDSSRDSPVNYSNSFLSILVDTVTELGLSRGQARGRANLWDMCIECDYTKFARHHPEMIEQLHQLLLCCLIWLNIQCSDLKLLRWFCHLEEKCPNKIPGQSLLRIEVKEVFALRPEHYNRYWVFLRYREFRVVTLDQIEVSRSCIEKSTGRGRR